MRELRGKDAQLFHSHTEWRPHVGLENGRERHSAGTWFKFRAVVPNQE